MDATFSPEDELQDSVSRMSALDLYEDLLIDEDKDDGNRVFTMQEILDEKKLLEAQNACLLNQISEMKLQMSEMSEENSRLQQHFDSLLATAKVELDRKNDLLNRYQTKCVCGSVAFPVNAACKDIFRKVERVAHKPKQKKKCLADLFKGRRVTEEELRRPGKTAQPIAPKKTPSDSKRGKKSTSVNAQSRKIKNNSGGGKTPALSNNSKELSPRRSARGIDADKRPTSKVAKACRDSENVKQPEQLPTKKTDLPLPTRDIALSQYAVIDEVSDMVDISADSLEKSTNNDIRIMDTHNTPVVSTTAARDPVKQKATSKRKSNEPRKIHRSPHVNLPQGPHRPLSQSQNVRQIAVTCSPGVSLSSRPPKRSNSSVSIDERSTGSPPFKKSRKSNNLQAARAQERSPNSASGVLNTNKSRNEQVLSITTRDLGESMAAPVLERNATSQSDQFVGKVTQPGNSGKTKDNGIAEMMSDAGIGCPDTTDAKRSDVKESSTNCESRYLAENDERKSASVNNIVEDHIRPDLDATALPKSKKRDSSLKRRDKPTLSESTSDKPDPVISSPSNRSERDRGSSPSTSQTVEAGDGVKMVKKGKKTERMRFSAGHVPVAFQPKVRLVDIRTRTPVKDAAESSTVKGDGPRTGKRRLFTQQSPDSPERMEAYDDMSIGSRARTSEITSTLTVQEADDVLFTDLQLSGDSENIDSAPDDESMSMFNASAVTSVEKNCQSVQPDGLEDNSCTATPSEPLKDIATSSKHTTTPSKPTTTSSKHVITLSKHATTHAEPSAATISKRITTPSKRTSSEPTTLSSKLVTILSEPIATLINHSTPLVRTTIISEHAATPSKHVTTPSQPTTSSNHSTPSKRTTTISEHTATTSQHATTSSNHSTPLKLAATISEHTTTPSKDIITPSSKRTITPSKFRRRAANVPPSQTVVRSPAPKEITPSKNSVRPPGTLSSWLATARSSNSGTSDYGNSNRMSPVDVPDRVDTVKNDQLATKSGNSRNAALRWLVKLGLEELEGKRRASQSRCGDCENGVEQAAAKGVVMKSFFHSQRKMWLTSLEKCQQRRKENAKWSS